MSKGKNKIGVWLLMENTSQSYGALSAIWDHTVLAATRHALTPARQAGTRFTYPGGMES